MEERGSARLHPSPPRFPFTFLMDAPVPDGHKEGNRHSIHHTLGNRKGGLVGGARASPTSLRDQRKQTMPGVRTGRVRPARHQFPLRVP